MIKYLGSKRLLVPRIVALAGAVPGVREGRTVLDLFTGTTRVAQGLKAAGFTVTANDAASYSEVLARTYIEVDARHAPACEAVIAELNARPGLRGYVTRTFCEEARFFQPKNGERIDAIRAGIDELAPDQCSPLRAMLLTALLEAADRVDSTTGLQMAYLKQWARRSERDLELRAPRLIAGSGRATRTDAVEFIARARAGGATYDIAYLDPPYNQHSYFSNYHIWETLVRGDAPESYGIARKRADCRTEKSAFNARSRAWAAMRAVVEGVDARHVILSFSDEGFFGAEAIATLLRERFAEVAIVPVPAKRYVGAQIGIHNPKGERVGEVSHLRNTELLFLAGPDAARIVARSGVDDVRALPALAAS